MSGKKLERYGKRLGILKVWANRLQTYLGPLNFLMILYLYITNEPLGIKWYYWVIAIIPTLLLVLYIDLKVILPVSQEYVFRKNPEWMLLKEEMRLLREDVKNLEKKLRR